MTCLPTCWRRSYLWRHVQLVCVCAPAEQRVGWPANCRWHLTTRTNTLRPGGCMALRCHHDYRTWHSSSGKTLPFGRLCVFVPLPMHGALELCAPDRANIVLWSALLAVVRWSVRVARAPAPSAGAKAMRCARAWHVCVRPERLLCIPRWMRLQCTLDTEGEGCIACQSLGPCGCGR